MRILSRSIISLVFALAGCGGSGHDTAISANGVPTTPIVGGKEVQVQLPVGAKVAQLVGPFGVVSVTSPVRFISNQTETLVIGVNDSGEPILAALLGPEGGKLDGRTSALAWTRVLLGPLPPDVKAADINTAITSAAGFSDLVTAFERAAAVGAAPGSDAGLQSALSVVLKEAVLAVQRSVTITSANSAESTVTTPLPFALAVDTVTHQLPVTLDGICLGLCRGDYNAYNDLALANPMPIWWAVTPRDPVTRVSLLSGDGPELLPGDSYSAARLVSGLGARLAWRYGVKANNNKSLLLEFAQTTDTRIESLTAAAGTAVETAMAFVPNTCNRAMLEPVVKNVVRELVNKQGELSERVLMDILKKSMSASNLYTLIKECAEETQPTRIAEYLIRMVEPLALADLVLSGSQLAAQIAYLRAYAKHVPVTYKVCVASDATVSNCTASFSFDPPVVAFIAPGVDPSSLTRLVARDINNSETGVPGGLQWSVSTDRLTIDQQTGKAKALDEVNGVVSVRDPLTGASGAYTVSVINPVLCPNSLEIGVGESRMMYLMTGQLNNCEGNPVLQAPGTEWVFEPSDRVSWLLSLVTPCPEPFGKATVKGTCIVVTGRAEGAVELTVSNGVTNATTKAKITVVPSREQCDRFVPGANTKCRYLFEPSELTLLTGESKVVQLVGIWPDGTKSPPFSPSFNWLNYDPDVVKPESDGTVHAIWEGETDLLAAGLGMLKVKVKDANWFPTRVSGEYMVSGIYIDPQTQEKITITDNGKFSGVVNLVRKDRQFAWVNISETQVTSGKIDWNLKDSPTAIPLYGTDNTGFGIGAEKKNGVGLFLCSSIIGRDWANASAGYVMYGQAELQAFPYKTTAETLWGTCTIKLE